MSVAIIDYGAGNIQSIRFALERLGVSATLSSDPETIQSASHVIFPISSRLNLAFHINQDRPPKSMATCARQSSIGKQNP